MLFVFYYAEGVFWHLLHNRTKSYKVHVRLGVALAYCVIHRFVSQKDVIYMPLLTIPLF